jgi:diguanylate cyclase (GGDEF)-like protein/PAS domain S-box-containing protein
MRAVVESLREVIWVHDLDGTMTYCSPSGGVVFGRSPEELHGTNEYELIYPRDRAERRAVVERLRATGAPQPPVDLRLGTRDGSYAWFEVTDSDLLGDPVVRSVVSSAHDVSARNATAKELIDLSLRDALTGLSNRVALMDRLEVALARTARTEFVLAVLFCDLDEFKAINDTLGHDAGDRMLQQVATRLQVRARRSDTVARIGGDEFVIVCEGLSGYDNATEMATQIRDAVGQPMELAGTPTRVSVSIGIAVVEGAAARGMEPTTVLENADAACTEPSARERLAGTCSTTR